VVGAPYPSLRGRWRAATLALGDHALLSHRDAAVLHDLASARRPAVEVTVPGRNARHQSGINPHRIVTPHADDRAVVEAIPVTSVARTLLDLAAILDPLGLRRAYEQAERMGVLDRVAIEMLLERCRGHHGYGRLRALAAYDPAAAARAESELERIFCDLLRRFGIPLPLVNVLVDGYLVDAYWPGARLVVELDGFEFHRDRDTFERDRRKLADLRRSGFEAVAFTYRQLTRDPEWVVGTVRSLLAAGERRRGRAPSL
jgi:very-short-patch-repair endonuclease